MSRGYHKWWCSFLYFFEVSFGLYIGKPYGNYGSVCKRCGLDLRNKPKKEIKMRLDQKVLRIDSRVKDGYYSDKYFKRTKEILDKDNYHPILKMQIFQ